MTITEELATYTLQQLLNTYEHALLLENAFKMPRKDIREAMFAEIERRIG